MAFCVLSLIFLLGCSGSGSLNESGVASFYDQGFAYRKTANGEIYMPFRYTAAHPTLPFGSWVRVVREDNGAEVAVRINDRGPFVDGRVIDLSRRAARALGMEDEGIVSVRLYLLD